ncbi:Strawberry notch helicase C domain-containing protein OS=Sphingobium scionense OX=1404341 GN=GGQ90_003986 PE=4 SV=1 [Sphingobium scionense]
MGGGTCRCAGVCDQHHAHCRRAFAADLEATAGRKSTRVYRLQTDDGERIVGRRVSPAWAATASANDNGPVLAPDAAFTALMDGQAILDLAERLQLRRVRVMGVNRIELDGFTDTMRDRLKAMGLISEIISWKLRLFVPTGSDSPTVLARLLDRYPLQRVGERHAA